MERYLVSRRSRADLFFFLRAFAVDLFKTEPRRHEDTKGAKEKKRPDRPSAAWAYTPANVPPLLPRRAKSGAGSSQSRSRS